MAYHNPDIRLKRLHFTTFQFVPMTMDNSFSKALLNRPNHPTALAITFSFPPIFFPSETPKS